MTRRSPRRRRRGAIAMPRNATTVFFHMTTDPLPDPSDVIPPPARANPLQPKTRGLKNESTNASRSRRSRRPCDASSSSIATSGRDVARSHTTKSICRLFTRPRHDCRFSVPFGSHSRSSMRTFANTCRPSPHASCSAWKKSRSARVSSQSLRLKGGVSAP